MWKFKIETLNSIEAPVLQNNDQNINYNRLTQQYLAKDNLFYKRKNDLLLKYKNQDKNTKPYEEKKKHIRQINISEQLIKSTIKLLNNI